MLSVGAITEVAMDSHNRFGDRFQRLWREETDNVCQTWVGLRVAMGHSHAAAGQQIVADQFLPFRDNDEAKIIGENIDIIQRGNGKSRLKLAWQINFSIKRIDKALHGRLVEIQFLTLDPDAMIRGCFRGERIRKSCCFFDHFIHERMCCWSRRGHHVAFDIAACSNSGDQHFVQTFDCLPQAGLYHAVKLKILSSSNPQSPIRVLIRQIITPHVLVWSQSASGKFCADHENELLGNLSFVAIILLVNAMKFQKLVIVVREPLEIRISQRLRDGSLQHRAGLFQALVAGRLFRASRFNHK